MSKSRRDILISAIGASAATLSGMLLVQRGTAQESTTQTLAQKSPNQSSMRILLLNPNSSPDFTKIIAREARRVASPGTEFVEVTSLECILDWFHIAKKFQNVNQALGSAFEKYLESAKCKLWQGKSDAALTKLSLLWAQP